MKRATPSQVETTLSVRTVVLESPRQDLNPSSAPLQLCSLGHETSLSQLRFPRGAGLSTSLGLSFPGPSAKLGALSHGKLISSRGPTVSRSSFRVRPDTGMW